MVQYVLGVSYTIFAVSQAIDVIGKRSKTQNETRYNWWKQTCEYNSFIHKLHKEFRRVLFLIVAIAQIFKALYLGLL